MGSTRDGLIRELQHFRRKVTREYPSSRMIVFGPRAHGKVHRFSDVDLIGVSPWFRRKDLTDRAFPLNPRWDLDYPVDLLCYTPEEFRKLSRRGGLVREALREGIALPP